MLLSLQLFLAERPVLPLVVLLALGMAITRVMSIAQIVKAKPMDMKLVVSATATMAL
jgi:hypothetical protein